MIEKLKSNFSLLGRNVFLGKASKNGMLGIGSLVVLVFLGLAIFGPMLASKSPHEISRERLLMPNWSHFFGTDYLGRDCLAMFIEGARISIFIGFVSTMLALIIGLIIGSIAGYFGGIIDSLLMRFTEIVMVIPRFFLALVIMSFLGRSMNLVILVIGGLGWMVIARITRAEFLSLKTRDFVEASRSCGASSKYIIFKTILPNAMPPILVYATLQVSFSMLLEAYLSFLGLGDPSKFSWGLQLRFAQDYLSSWWIAFFPGLGLLFVVLGVNLLGEGIREILDPTFSQRKYGRSIPI